MNKYTLACFFASISFVASCSTKNEVAVEELSLTGTEIEIDSSEILNRPWVILGDKVISMQLFGKNDYHVSLLKDNKICKSEPLFKIGKGHNEFTYIKFGKRYDNSLLLLDGDHFLFSMTLIPNVKSIDDLKNLSKWEKFNVKDMDIFAEGLNFYPMSDSTVLMSATPRNEFGHILSILDYKNQKCIPLEYWPDDGVEIDSLVKCRVYTAHSRIYGNGNGSYLFLCGRERYAFIFTIDGNKVNVVKNLYTIYPKYRTENHMDPIIETVRTERLECAASNKYLYMLLTDVDRNGEKVNVKDYNHHPKALYGNTIEIYDWNGNLQKKLKLDHYGRRLIISDDGTTLYVFSDDYFEGVINPQIWSYNLVDIE